MRILFLSPHTDDVELGAGGTLVKFLERGYDVFWVVFSTAEDSLPNNLPKDTLRNEFLSVVNSLGLKENNYKIFSFKVRRLHEHRQEILEEIVKLRKDIAPELVIGPSLNDYHQDHQVVAWEMIRAFKNSSSVICYELPWNHTSFNAQLFVKLNDNHVKQKVKLLSNYKSQINLGRRYFSEDFIVGWARMRGIQVKSDYAEAFEVIRWML